LISFLIKVKENILIAYHALRQHPLRTILTTLGIIIGTLTIISIASIIQGLNTKFEESVSFFGARTLYIQKYPWMSREWFKYRNRPDITMEEFYFVDDNLGQELTAIPNISTNKNVKYDRNTIQGIQITGAVKETEMVDNVTISSGRFFTEMEIDRNSNKVVIGYSLEKKLFSGTDPVNKRVRINDHLFKVIGVLEKRGQFLGNNLDNVCYIPMGSFFKNFGFNHYLSIKIKVPKNQKMEKAKEQVSFMTRLARGLRPGEEKNFSINQQDIINQQYQKLTGGLYTAAIGIGALSLLVGGIGIMNIMLVSVSERKREIGVRKALGATKRVLIFQFLTESIIVCSIGGAIAIGLSYLAAWGIDQATPFPAQVPIWAVFLGLGFSSFVGMTFGMYPAIKAARLDPIETLHYE